MRNKFWEEKNKATARASSPKKSSKISGIDLSKFTPAQIEALKAALSGDQK